MINIPTPMCGQCGKHHPPLPPGAECPNAVVRSQAGKIIDFERIFIPLKSILKSQIEKRGIKNIDKLFGFTIVQLTKILENYEEK